MINKESQRRNIVEDRQRKIKDKEKVEDMQRKTGEKDRKLQTCKVQNTGKKRLERTGSEKTKIKKYMFHLENRQ